MKDIIKESIDFLYGNNTNRTDSIYEWESIAMLETYIGHLENIILESPDCFCTREILRSDFVKENNFD